MKRFLPLSARLPSHTVPTMVSNTPNDISRERGAGQFERAADLQRLVAVALEPALPTSSMVKQLLRRPRRSRVSSINAP
jgi:hypothetical protein